MRAYPIFLLVFLIALPAAAGGTPPPQAPASVLTGTWLGTLRVAPGAELRIVFRIADEKNGALGAKLDSPDQGAVDIPVESVSFRDGALRLQIPAIRGSYAGRLSPDNRTIVGTWTQMGGSLPLNLQRVDKVESPRRPQEPKKPYPYDEEEVVYANERAAGIRLAGTLTRPRGAGPFPALLLITGSGPQNRDEEILGHKPFLVLADWLTRRGIAVLRVDDRGVGGSGGDFRTATTEDFASDALAGVAYLKGRTDIDNAKIGLLGHSEGGLVAPLAARSPYVAFVVLLAGPGLTGEQILYRQSALIARAMGAPEPAIAWSRALQERAFTLLKTEKDDATVGKKLRVLFAQMPRAVAATAPDAGVAGKAAAKPPRGEPPRGGPGAPDPLVEAQIRMLRTPWFRFFLTYDPRPALTQLRCPVLALLGEKDLQVPAPENARALREALEAGGNKNYAVEVLPGLNHLFQTARTGSPAEYAGIEETIAPAALGRIGDWIAERVR